MGLYLIGAVNWNTLLVIVEVAFGLGMLIFIHELGHFMVAKWCGVKCEKFYLGFDIFGLKLFKFRRGETEYGIGLLPLGGYVKMLGQDDNPNRFAEERERSKARSEEGLPPESGNETLNPRSYMAKSVPQRMAIISAGVIMNLLLAVVMASVAYGLGVREVPCGISQVAPGEAAWREGLRPGDQVLQIGELGKEKQLLFTDLMHAVSVGDIDDGVRFLIDRPGVKEPFWVTLHPDYKGDRGRPTIGVVFPRTNVLSDEMPVQPFTVAAKAGAFQKGDKIIAVNGEPINDYTDLHTQLARHRDKPLEFTVERKSAESDDENRTTVAKVEVPPQRQRVVGLVMEMGPIAAIQKDSPAAEADLKVGDKIITIDGQAPGDPMTLPDRLWQRGEETITIEIERLAADGKPTRLEKQVTLRQADWFPAAPGPDSPVAIPALGVAYPVLNVVAGIAPDSPAAHAQVIKGKEQTPAENLRPGDKVVKAEFVPPQDEELGDGLRRALDPIESSDGKAIAWPHVMARLQALPPGTKLKLTLADDRIVELPAVESDQWFDPDRGLVNTVSMVTVEAGSFGDAVARGARKTLESSLLVFRFLRALVVGQVSPDNLGGVGTIATVAAFSAEEGIAQLLIFLTMLSANLAVLNILPIPVLDGGHLMFLAWEGIRGKPPSEKIHAGLTYVGLAMILFLMIYANGLDVGRLFRWLS